MRHAHDGFVAGDVSPAVPVRSLVADSWRRSAAAGVDPDVSNAPVVVGSADLAGYREAHPLADVFPLLYDVLGRAAEACDAVMAVADAHGRLLWVTGTPGVLDRAERIHFVEGAAWDESHAGTNAPGTALELDASVQILAAEHFARPVQPWSCAASPIHDPATQAILGVVDVTGADDVAVPQTMAMVRAAARMAEAELGRLQAVASPRGAAAGLGAGLRAHGLGRPDCLLEVDGRRLRLSPRHSEILVLLADRPDGLTGEQLAVDLYPDHTGMSTLRAELTRLRALLGADTLASRPYRLCRPLHADWLAVAADLDRGRAAEAARGYRGPLLPQSEAPGVVERRDRLDRQLRAGVLASGALDLVAAWTRSRWGADDLDMWRRQAALAPSGSPLHVIATAELRRLDRELGVRPGVRS